MSNTGSDNGEMIGGPAQGEAVIDYVESKTHTAHVVDGFAVVGGRAPEQNIAIIFYQDVPKVVLERFFGDPETKQHSRTMGSKMEVIGVRECVSTILMTEKNLVSLRDAINRNLERLEAIRNASPEE